MFSTAGYILGLARAQNPRFMNIDRHPNVLALQFLSQRHRLLFKDVCHDFRDRVSIDRSIGVSIGSTIYAIDPADGVSLLGAITPLAGTSPTVGSGLVIGGDGIVYMDAGVVAGGSNAPGALGPDGVPYHNPPGEVRYGYAYVFGGDNVPYFSAVASGFPLPDDLIELIDVYAINNQKVRIPIMWRPQSDYSKLTGLSGLITVVRNWMLVPVMNPPDIMTFWNQVTSVIVAYIPDPPDLVNLTDPLRIPRNYDLELANALAVYFGTREHALDKEGFDETQLEMLVTTYDSERKERDDRTLFDHLPYKTKSAKRNR